uniref:UBC core domain-containing protein n=1 Tax=Panagrolaimus sp. ES5 TaxID=591445 RepID=A0AC34GQP6_9BILA
MAARSAGVRRLMREASELSQPTDMYVARPLEDNLFEWHFTIKGPPDSPYQDGIYHGRITLPHDYPMKPPSLMMLTPTGRFETNTKICLSISAYHPETWLPSWSIGTALTALIAFMETEPKGALGALDCSEEQRKKLAKESLKWKCPECGCNMKEIFDLMKEQAAQKPKDMDSKSAETVSNVEETFQSDTVEKPADTSQLETKNINGQPENFQETSIPQLAPTSPPFQHIPVTNVIQPVPSRPSDLIQQQQSQPAVANSSSTGLLIFVFSAIFFALLFRRLSSMQ